MAAYELKYTAEEIDGILESVDEKTIYDDATQSAHGLMSAEDKSKLDALPTSQQLDSSLSGKVDKVDGKGLSTNDYDATAKGKVDAIPQNPKYTDTVYDDTALSGRVSTIEGKESGWDAKQDALVSGTNIKTVNGESLLGSGNIEIQGGGGSGEENVIETVKVNGVALTPDSEKAVDVDVPTKTSDLQNDSGFITGFTETDPTVPSWAKQPNKPSYNYSEIGNTPDLSGFITKSVNDLTNYYLKSDTYTKAEVAALIGAIQQFHYEIYPALPQSGESNVLYLIGPTGSGSDRYEEYVYSNNTFTKIGDTSIDLSGYVTTSALNTALADYATTQDLEDSKVFWAEVGVTTFAEIQDAIDAGRTVMLKDENGYTYVLSYIDMIDMSNISFSCSVGDESLIKTYYIYDDDSWEFLSLSDIETKQNLVQSISSSSDNDHYPSAFAVYQALQSYTPTSQLATVATSGSYNDLTNKPTIPTVPVQDVTVGGTSVVSNGTAVIPAIPDTSDFEASANKVSTITGNETNTTKYPNTKAVADALGKWGVISQTQTWSGTGTQPRTYVMSDLVYGTIPQANIDLFESAGAIFNTTSGYFELNELKDISYEEMKVIYQNPLMLNMMYNQSSSTNIGNEFRFANSNTRTNILRSERDALGNCGTTSCLFHSSKDEILILGRSSTSYTFLQGGQVFYSCYNLRKILGIIKLTNGAAIFSANYSLEDVKITMLGYSLDFSKSSLLNLNSIVYMVENAANTSAITITLHADAYARCQADTTEYTYSGNTYTGVLALATAHNITIASA